MAGVKYERFGKLEVARARKEVIISAGTVGSPKILLLSGIGPEDDLKRLKVTDSHHAKISINRKW